MSQQYPSRIRYEYEQDPETRLQYTHGVWGGINLLEGYGADNPASKSQGIKQLVAGGGVALIGMTLVPLLSGLLG